MKTLLTTTALAAFIAAPVLAQSADTAASTETETEAASTQVSADAEIVASDFLGKTVYAAGSLPGEGDEVADPGEDWEAIGEVGDVLISSDGQVQAIVLDIGGFLGMGEHQVAITMDQLAMVNDADQDGAYFIVTDMSEEALEEQPEFDIANFEGWEATVDPQEAMESAEAETEEAAAEVEETAENAAEETEEAMETAEAETEEAAAEVEETAENAAEETEEAMETAEAETEAAAEAEETAENATEETEEAMETAEAETEAAAEEAEETAESMEADDSTEEVAMDTDEPRGTAPVIEREGWSMADAKVLTSEDLTGAPLYDVSDEVIGEVSKLILDDSGQITEAVLDVGGFLGLGEHSVAMKIESLNIQTSAESGEIRVYVDATEEELEAMEEWNDG